MARQIWRDIDLAGGAMSQPDALRVLTANRQQTEPARLTWQGAAGTSYSFTRVAPSRARLSSSLGAALFVQ